ncbi:hypothetical protein LCGC14_1969610 [marine sediment metagenome]|uniref:Uncharacterized protein n=1 Tax=marine sediment metagenome TaxID=412755 RepID=A0A0F9EZ12_9ZZZZ
METKHVDIEKSIYLKALNKNDVYKKYLLSLFDDVDNSVQDCKKFTFKEIVNIIKNLNYQVRKNSRSQLLPILVSSDSEKEKCYNLLKEEFRNQMVLYIPLCPIDVRIYHHICSCLIEDLGLEIFETMNLKSIKIKQKLKKSDAVKILLEYQQHSSKKDLIRHWLLGDELKNEEKNRLGIKTSIGDDKNSLDIIECICDSFEEPVMLFFDDIEAINQKYGTEFGEKWGRVAEHKFLKTFFTFLSIINKAVIILPCIKKSWNELLNFSNNDLRSILESRKIEFFDFERLKKKIMKVMDFYWLQSKIRPPINPLFPLSDDSIEKFFKKSQGDLKKFFTLCIKTIENILMGKKIPGHIE